MSHHRKRRRNQTTITPPPPTERPALRRLKLTVLADLLETVAKQLRKLA